MPENPYESPQVEASAGRARRRWPFGSMLLVCLLLFFPAGLVADSLARDKEHRWLYYIADWIATICMAALWPLVLAWLITMPRRRRY